MAAVAIRENLPEQAGLFSDDGKLSDLMWVVQVDWNGWRLQVYGIIKPDLSLKTISELRKQLTDSYDKICNILEESKVWFWSHPELEIKGRVAYLCDNDKPNWEGLEATIRIELATGR